MFNDLFVRRNYRKLWLVSCLMVNKGPCEFIFTLLLLLYTDINTNRDSPMVICMSPAILGLCRTRFFSSLVAIIFLDELERLTRTWR